MATQNKTKYAILGVLSMKPGSGYDIKKFCDKSISYFWNENFGHIYPVLNQLEKEELIKHVDAQDESRKKIYSITDNGREVFYQWLLKPVEQQPARSELLLKLSFGANIPSENLLDMLVDMKSKNETKLKEYKSIEETYVNDKNKHALKEYPYWLAPLRYGILASEASIKWCDETIRNINEHNVRMKSL